MNADLTNQKFPMDTNTVESFDLYPGEKDGDKKTLYGWYAVYFKVGKIMHEHRFRAVSLNEAIGAFLAENDTMTYGDIYEHCEI